MAGAKVVRGWLAQLKSLNDGNKIPMLGFGTYLENRTEAFSWVLQAGYRLLDTATLYNNEDEVGQAVRESDIPREEIFVVTKVWNDSHGKENTIQAFNTSLRRLGLKYVDLYLMHSAMGGKTLETWDAMIELKKQGLTKSIGVANFNAHHLRELKKARPNDIPAVNQIETHPFCAWDECVSYCQQEGIAVMAYSPLAKAMKLDDPTLCAIAKKYGKSPAQVMIRWSLQRGFVCIPRTSNKDRVVENADVSDFEISKEDMETLTGLDERFISDWPRAMDSPWDP